MDQQELLEGLDHFAFEEGADEVVAELFDEIGQLDDIDEALFNRDATLFVRLSGVYSAQRCELLRKGGYDVAVQSGCRHLVEQQVESGVITTLGRQTSVHP